MDVIDQLFEHASQRPSAPALVVDRASGGTDCVSYAELADTVRAHAAQLRRDGVLAGDRCGLFATQGREFIEAALGILAAQGCLVPLGDGRSQITADAIRTRCRLHHVLHARTRALESLPPAAVDGNGDQDFRRLRPGYLRFTSGTTNVRKGVVIGHDAIRARLAAANQALGIGPEDRILWVLPMEHHFVVSILLYLNAGATILLPDSTLPDSMLSTAERHAATVLYVSPYHVALLAKAQGAGRLRQLRLAISTTAGLTSSIAESFEQRFQLPLTQALGIIEVGLPVINVSGSAGKSTALGRPLPAYDVWLRDEQGRRVDPNGGRDACGEICIRGPGMFDAYLDPWTPAAQILSPDGFRTGDWGWFDADGDLHLAGRRVNRINTAGMKFFCEEVEAVLERHPKVATCRVSARPHENLGEVAVAEVVARDPLDPPRREELLNLCRQHLDPYKIPRAFTVVAELAMTATGKLKRWSGGVAESPE